MKFEEFDRAPDLNIEDTVDVTFNAPVHKNEILRQREIDRRPRPKSIFSIDFEELIKVENDIKRLMQIQDDLSEGKLLVRSAFNALKQKDPATGKMKAYSPDNNFSQYEIVNARAIELVAEKLKQLIKGTSPHVSKKPKRSTDESLTVNGIDAEVPHDETVVPEPEGVHSHEEVIDTPIDVLDQNQRNPVAETEKRLVPLFHLKDNLVGTILSHYNDGEYTADEAITELDKLKKEAEQWIVYPAKAYSDRRSADDDYNPSTTVSRKEIKEIFRDATKKIKAREKRAIKARPARVDTAESALDDHASEADKPGIAELLEKRDADSERNDSHSLSDTPLPIEQDESESEDGPSPETETSTISPALNPEDNDTLGTEDIDTEPPTAHIIENGSDLTGGTGETTHSTISFEKENVPKTKPNRTAELESEYETETHQSGPTEYLNHGANQEEVKEVESQKENTIEHEKSLDEQIRSARSLNELSSILLNLKQDKIHSDSAGQFNGSEIAMLILMAKNGTATVYAEEFTRKHDIRDKVQDLYINEKGVALPSFYDLSPEAQRSLIHGGEISIEQEKSVDTVLKPVTEGKSENGAPETQGKPSIPKKKDPRLPPRETSKFKSGLAKIKNGFQGFFNRITNKRRTPGPFEKAYKENPAVRSRLDRGSVISKQ